MSRLLAWQPRLLEFDSARLADVVAAFNRHNRLQLELGDATLADLPVGASFRSNNVEGFVRLLEGGFGIRTERNGDRIVLLRAP
jgi:transmembrane sensor